MYIASPRPLLLDTRTAETFELSEAIASEFYYTNENPTGRVECAVYNGIRTRDGCRCHVKVVPSAFLRPNCFLFYDEAAVLSAVHHKHIVALCGAGPAGIASSYMDMRNVPVQYLATERLSRVRICDREGMRADWVISRVFRKLVRTVRHLHARGIVHRNITRDCIMLSEDRQIKLTGFSVAGLAAPAYTRAGFYREPYSAPETHPDLYQKVYSQTKAEIYTLGINLLSMKLGHLPAVEPFPWGSERFKDSGYWSHLEALEQTQLSPSLRNLLKAMLRADPERRISLEQVLDHPWLNPEFIDGTEDMAGVVTESE